MRVVGEGKNHWPCVYDRDLADLYVRLAAQPDASGVFHANDEADEQRPLASEPVAERTGGEQGSCEDDGVRVEDPLDLRRRRAELDRHGDPYGMDAEIRVLIERVPETACSDCEVELTRDAG